MILDITIQADSDNPSDLNALAALIASLGGRLASTQVTVGNVSVTGTEQFVCEQLADVAPNAPTTSTSPSGTAVQPTSTVSTPPAPDQEADETDEAAVAGAPSVDANGIPWDARIHSASRATVADGTWRRRKNTPDATYDSVMAELAGAVPPPPAETTTSDTPEPPAPTVADTAPVVAAATTAADVPPPPTDALDISTWPKFVQAVQAKPGVPETSKTYDALNELSVTFGAAKFLEMKDKAAQWPMFYDMVG